MSAIEWVRYPICGNKTRVLKLCSAFIPDVCFSVVFHGMHLFVTVYFFCNVCNNMIAR